MVSLAMRSPPQSQQGADAMPGDSHQPLRHPNLVTVNDPKANEPDKPADEQLMLRVVSA